MKKGVYKDKECTSLVIRGVNEIADLVTKTMGPYGKTIILTDLHGNSRVTKDGYSVVKEIEFDDPIKNSAATMLKQVSKNTVEEAGDATTTSICFARSIINKGFSLMLEDKLPYIEIKKELDMFEEHVNYILNTNKKKVTKKGIVDVATISVNGDKDLGILIADAYNKASLVKVEENIVSKDELLVINGMKLNTGFFDKAFINNPSKQSIEYSNVPVMIIDGHLTDLKNIAPIINNYPDGIIIIADHFSESVISIFRGLYNKNQLNVGLVKSPGFATHRKDLIKDLSLFTSSPIINPSQKQTISELGIASSVKVTQEEFIISKDVVDPEVEKTVKELKNSLDTLSGTTKDLLLKRIENLTGSLAIIKVGASTDVERAEKKDRIDDAVLAVKCALDEGIIEGGGKLLYLNSTTIGTLFAECAKAPYQTIIANGASMSLKDNFFELGIIDPVKATRVAFKNAVSVAKTILSTEGAIITERIWI